MATAFDKGLDQERAAADRFPDRVVIRDPAETELPEIVAVVVAEEPPAATPQPRVRPWGPLLLALYNLLGLHVHYAVVGDFQPRFSGSYVLGPFGAAGLGFTLFVILQAVFSRSAVTLQSRRTPCAPRCSTSRSESLPGWPGTP